MAFGTPVAQVFGFADGAAGHVCTFSAGAPSVGDHDVLCVNSDVTVSTPTGFTAAVSVVTNQGAYIFTRKAAGGESASVTITTGSNLNTNVTWVRIPGGAAVDVTGSAQVNAAPGGTTTPALTTAALAENTEFALAFAALHALPSGAPSAPVWSGGYTALASGSQGTGSGGVAAFVAYKQPAGTAAEAPSVSWTNGATDRYMLFVSLTQAAGGASVAPAGIAVPVALGSPDVTWSASIAPDGITVPVALGDPIVGAAAVAPDGISVPVALGAPSLTWSGTVSPDGISIPVVLGAPGAGTSEHGSMAAAYRRPAATAAPTTRTVATMTAVDR